MKFLNFWTIRKVQPGTLFVSKAFVSGRWNGARPQDSSHLQHSMVDFAPPEVVPARRLPKRRFKPPRHNSSLLTQDVNCFQKCTCNTSPSGGTGFAIRELIPEDSATLCKDRYRSCADWPEVNILNRNNSVESLRRSRG